MSNKVPFHRPLVLIGMGGHAGVLTDIARLLDLTILGGVDLIDAGPVAAKKLNVPYLGTDDYLEKLDPNQVSLVNCIGSASNLGRRDDCFERWKQKGYSFLSLIHPKSTVSPRATLGEGCQLMAGAVVQPYAVIGPNCIVNTNASVDHDCVIGRSCHIAPGVSMSGNVIIGRRSHIGTGAKIIQGIRIGENCLIAAGAVVVKAVGDSSLVKGVPGSASPKK